MKLSLNAGCLGTTDPGALVSFACSLGYRGIELGYGDAAKAARGGVFAFKRALADADTVLSSVVFNAGVFPFEETAEKLEDCVRLSHSLKAMCVTLSFPADYAVEKAYELIEKVLPAADENKTVIAVETSGVFSCTAALRQLLESFASDSLAADWNLYETFFAAGEKPEDSIKNLGAYVVNAHFTDASALGEYTLAGEGALPAESVAGALSSVNYSGFLTPVWEKDFYPGLDDPEAVFTHFAGFASHIGDPAKAERHFFWNKTHTGKFIWKKDELIDETFPGVLDMMAETFPDKICFRYTTLDYTRTYSQFRADVDAFAKSLIALGVKPQAHVSVWATNVPQWYIAFWAVTKIGAVMVSMNTAYKIHEAEYILRQSDTHTLILTEGFRDSDYSGIISELCPELASTARGESLHSKRLPFLRNVITVGFSIPGGITWDEAIQRGGSVSLTEVNRRARLVSPDDVCNMQYTSGTTGFPKGVMLTHRNVVNNGKCIGDRMDLSTEDRMMIQVPMFHCFGMVLAMTAAITHSCSLHPLPYFSPKPALQCINTEKITCFHGVPTMFIAMLQHESFKDTDFSHMRTGIMAGSPCPIAVMRDVVEKMNMREITIVYGQTEASPGCTMSSTDDPLEVRVATVGRPLPEIECKIIDPETGLDCPDGVNGEFVARGYNIMKGYYKMPAEYARTVDREGWLHTGDIACRTPEGNYMITGRLKDMIIRGGENIYPKEIEEFIYTHPKVRDVQVIGVPDKTMGEEIMASIILKENETMTVDEMKKYVLDHMAKHKVPRYITFTDSFPMNDAGKILKYKMRENAIRELGIEV